MKKYTSYYIMAAVAAVCMGIGLYLWLHPKAHDCAAALPKEAKLVGRVDFLQISGRETILNRYVGNFLAPEILKETGIDFTDDAYFFLYQSYIGAVVSLRDEGDFLSFATRGKHGVERQRGLKWSVAGNSFLVCSDGHKAMLMGPAAQGEQEQLRNVMAACMRQEASQASASLMEKLSSEDAASLATTLGCLPDACTDVLRNVVPKDVDWGGAYVTARLSLSDSAAVMNVGLQENCKALAKYLDKLDESMLRLEENDERKNKIHSTISEVHSTVFLNFGVDGTKLLELLRQNEALRTKLLAANMLFDLDMIVKSIRGQVTFASCDSRPFSGEHLIEAQITDDSFMQNIPSWNEGLSQYAGVQFLPARNDTYLFAWQDYAYYFGTHNGKLFLTNTDRYTQVANIEPVVDSLKPNGEKLYASMNVQKMLEGMKDLLPNVRLPQRITLHMNDVRHWRMVVEREAEQ